MNTLQKIHKLFNQKDTSSTITEEGVFQSYLRARFGRNSPEALVNDTGLKAQFEAHIDALFRDAQ
jgi:hypothetical protein